MMLVMRRNLVVEGGVTEFLPEAFQFLLNNFLSLHHGKQRQGEEQSGLLLGKCLQQRRGGRDTCHQTNALAHPKEHGNSDGNSKVKKLFAE